MRRIRREDRTADHFFIAILEVKQESLSLLSSGLNDLHKRHLIASGHENQFKPWFDRLTDCCARGFLQCHKAREMLMARSAECHRSDNRCGLVLQSRYETTLNGTADAEVPDLKVRT